MLRILDDMQATSVTNGLTATAPSLSMGRRDSTRILLIVEEPLLRLDLADGLESFGYAVDEILTSEQPPLEGAFQLGADVVVFDAELMGRLNAIQAERPIGARWRRPIVYLVDDVQQADRVDELGAGAPHVMWPFAPGVLDEAIRNALKKKSTVQSSEMKGQRRHP